MAKLNLRPNRGKTMTRIAVVTGAAGGMGRAISDRLIEDGLQVVGVDIDGPALLAMAADRDRFHPEVCDLTDADAIADLFDRITDRFGEWMPWSTMPAPALCPISQTSRHMSWTVRWPSTFHPPFIAANRRSRRWWGGPACARSSISRPMGPITLTSSIRRITARRRPRWTR